MGEVLGRFSRTSDAIRIADGDQARFRGLVLDATNVLKNELGLLNEYNAQIENERIRGISNFLESQSYSSVEQIIDIVRAGARAVERAQKSPTVRGRAEASRPSYVDERRLAELRHLAATDWDLRRLIRLCEELNLASAHKCHISTAALVRSITDHVPPVFGASNFREYANSIAARSLKASMLKLDDGLRNIADGILHQHIRESDSLPGENQVDYRQQLDVLLGEVIRVLS